MTRQERILKAAADLMSQGIELSVRRIAREAAISVGALALYFPGRSGKAIVAAIVAAL